MKKISLVLFIVSALFISCGERYEEERGQVFEGTWTLVDSYIDTARVSSNVAKFFTAREFGEEHLLLFYSGGHYDSSFFYRIQDNNVFVRRVLDSVDVIYRYHVTDSLGNILLDESGNKISAADTIREVQKPSNPQTGYSPEKYYGEISFIEGAQLTLTITRYFTNKDGAPITTSPPYGRDIYSRPLDTE
jgi:hypothetical protein